MSDLNKNQKRMIDDSHFRGDTFLIDLWYPRLDDHTKEIKVGLMDVRAADSIRISYDFGRDGWVIKQASTFEWPADDSPCDSDWQEVAFIQAWAREKPNPACVQTRRATEEH